MNKLAEKIKEMFKRREKLETSDLQKDRLNGALWGANDISRSIRESNKLQMQMQKNLLRRIFHF